MSTRRTRMKAIGMMTMPVGFKYEKTHLKGRPRHEKYSDFWCRHVPMDSVHRAKIFTAFDALKGFDEAIEAKEVQYVAKKKPDEDELNRKLQRVCRYNGKVKITWFVPCSDQKSEAYDPFEPDMGLYQEITGTVWNIDKNTETLRIGTATISFDDIANIEFIGEKEESEESEGSEG